MELTFFETPTPHIIIDKIFTEDDLNFIWKEIELLTPNLLDESETGSATEEYDEKILKKKNLGMFLHQMYNVPNISAIISKTQNRLFNENIVELLPTNHWFVNMYRMCNWISVLLSYYEKEHYYKPHRDISVFTALIWLWKEPKQFTGGDFMFSEHDYSVECKNNRAIIFLGPEQHAVSTVNVNEEFIGKNYGRYTISCFTGLKSA